ncbi:hypothetical protein ACFUN8_07030 [Streptomyces sp. NPDC057307]|uniref:hypothetical protein n=1 Tax=Streptomyces sp. NPDC057307 TaxID=3346096 RepID=UPI003636B683
MRKRAVLVSVGIAVLAITGINAPAQAAAPGTSVSAGARSEAAWVYIGSYSSRAYCVDAGQQYVREGFSKYRCDAAPGGTGYYELFVS